MYFSTTDTTVIATLAEAVTRAMAQGRRLRIDVDATGNLRYKVGEGMWSAPIASTADPYRDQSQGETMADRYAREVAEGRIRKAFTTEHVWLVDDAIDSAMEG